MKPVDRDFRLKDDSIYLRPITADDTGLVLGWRNSPEIVNNFIYRKQISVAEHMDWLENKVQKGLVHQFVICAADTGTPLGSVYIQNFDEDNRRAEWGLFLGTEGAHGRGVGTRTGNIIIDYAFGMLDLHKMTSRVLACNKPCIRMNEKLGYRQEAYLREELFIDGKYEDLILYGALKGDVR